MMKASPNTRSIMEHMPGLHQDTKSLRSCSRNWAKTLLKGHLGIKCHSQYNEVIRLLQYSSTNGVNWGCIVRDLETIIVLVLLTFNFIPQRSHHSQTLPRSQIRDSASVTLTPGEGTTDTKVESHQHNQSAYFQYTNYSVHEIQVTLRLSKAYPTVSLSTIRVATPGSSTHMTHHPTKSYIYNSSTAMCGHMREILYKFKCFWNCIYLLFHR